MRITICFASMILAAGLLVGPAAAVADEPQSETPAPAGATNGAKEQALQWLGEYRKVQVLFHDGDIARLQKQLEADTPEQAAKWWAKTAGMREALDSPEWQVTREWLKEFLKVQAIYSDEQIERFREETKDAAESDSTTDFKAMLTKIESMRKDLVKGAADAKALREQQLSVLNAYRSQEANQRSEAAAYAASTASATDPISNPVRIRAPRYPQAPLIDSMDVARWSIMRGFWRR